jgi:hypothetical protein
MTLSFGLVDSRGKGGVSSPISYTVVYQGQTTSNSPRTPGSNSTIEMTAAEQTP